MSYKNENERDDFWDLSKLVPKKKTMSQFATKSPSVLYAPNSDTVEKPKRDDSERKLDLSGVNLDAEAEIYTPKNHSLIKKVVIKKHLDRFDFYDSFRKAAIVYFDYKTDKCDFVQYYSYMPQYSQLSPSQKSYYFYWRDMIRQGKFIKTDYSYLYLYVYEIINLPDLIPPEDGLSILISLWREYRGPLPRLDLYFSIWVQDYCLIHKLPAPTERISDFIFDVISSSAFPEFYLSDWKCASEHGVVSILAYLSDYDYRRGKYADGNPDSSEDRRKRQAELYKMHIESAMRIILFEIEHVISLGGADASIKTLRRDAFPNSLCTHAVKRRLEIEYYSIGATSSLRIGITAAVRYAENKMRGLMGVKSRLAVKGLPDNYKAILDGYFEALEKRERRIREEESVPEYERLYSAPKEKLSLKSADIIEASSWGTTERLVAFDDFVDDAADEPLTVPSDADNTCTDTAEAADTYGLDNASLDYLSHLIVCDASVGIQQSDFELEAIVERINEAFADNFGDIIIESDGFDFKIIDDYKEDVKEWLSTIPR